MTTQGKIDPAAKPAMGATPANAAAKSTTIAAATAGAAVTAGAATEKKAETAQAAAGKEDVSRPLKDRGWHYAPYMWSNEAKAWVSAEKVPPQKLEKKTITVVSWNVWFGNLKAAERMVALGNVISAQDPDLIALQECTAGLNQLLLSQEWCRKYFVSDPAGKEFNGYGCMIMSKVRFHELMLRNFESRMGRKALIGSLLVKDSSQLTFGTFHLESYPQDAPYRKKQLELYRQLVDGCPRVILCGDTNFTRANEDAALGERFADAWPAVHLATEEDKRRFPGLTFDSETNKMCAAQGNFAMARIDRLYLTKATLKPTAMEIIGTKPLEKEVNIWPSDHYGICCKIELL